MIYDKFGPEKATSKQLMNEVTMMIEVRFCNCNISSCFQEFYRDNGFRIIELQLHIDNDVRVVDTERVTFFWEFVMYCILISI